MQEKPKGQPQSLRRSFVIILAIVPVLLTIGLIIPMPNENGLNRPILLDLYERILPASAVRFNGESWEMLIDVERNLDKAGEVVIYPELHRVVLEMHSEGNTLYGSYSSASRGVCSNASFVGTIDGNMINWLVSYSGDCCPGAQMEFTGTVAASREQIEGELSPIGLPPEGCWIWWADVSLYRQ